MTIKIECEVSELSELLAKLNPSNPSLDTYKQAHIRDLMVATLEGKKIAAIKAVRGIFQTSNGETLGLREAKDLVEKVNCWTYQPWNKV